MIRARVAVFHVEHCKTETTKGSQITASNLDKH